MTFVIIIIVVFLLIAIGIIVFVCMRFGGSSNGTAKISRTTYDNPTYAAGNTTPPWADPNVPFLSREEAETKVRSDGMHDGSYVVRQTTNTPDQREGAVQEWTTILPRSFQFGL